MIQPDKGALTRTFFIAAAPPKHIQDVLEKIRHQDPANWRWQHPEDYHISMAFPGKQDEAGLEKIKDALSKLKFQPFKVAVHGLKSFNRSGHPQEAPHVLWAGLNASGDAHFRELHKRLCAELEKSGIPFGKRDQEPHITVAKVPNNDIDGLLKIIRDNDDLSSADWLCDEVILYETFSKSRPADSANESPYREIARFKFNP